MASNSETRWIRIGKYTINLDTVRFVVEHHQDEMAGDVNKLALEVWCIGETKPFILLHGDQAQALRDFFAYPRRVEDLTPQSPLADDESEGPDDAG